MKYSRKIKRYLREISRMLPEDTPDKQWILNNLKSDIRSYLEEHADAVWKDILEEFGTAVDVASSVLGESMNAELISVMRQRNHLYNLVVGVTIGCIAMILGIYAYQYWWLRYEHRKVNPTVYVYDGTEVSAEVFEEKIDSEYE